MPRLPRTVRATARRRQIDGVGVGRQPALNVAGILILMRVFVTMSRRWRAASRPSGDPGPVYGAGALTLLLLPSRSRCSCWPPGRARGGGLLRGLVGFVLMPYVFLGGLLRSRVFQAGAVGELMAGLAETPVPAPARRARPRPGRRDADAGLLAARACGATWTPPARRWSCRPPGSGRVGHAGRARWRSAIARDHPRRVADRGARSWCDAVGGAAALALENERLDAELRARLEELRASRARLVEAGDRRAPAARARPARRRAAAAGVAGAERCGWRAASSAGDPDAPARAARRGRARSSTLALEELRELARGIHPAVLTDRGLGAALRGARRAARRCRSSCARAATSGCPTRSSRRPTSWSPRR